MTWAEWSILGLAALGGLIGGLAGNRSAWPLLASLALCLLLDWQEVEFAPLWWMVIDCLVIAFILGPEMRKRDIAIIVLFIPAWAGYLLSADVRFHISFAVVLAQLLLTFPTRRFWRRTVEVNRTFDPWDQFDMRTAAA